MTHSKQIEKALFDAARNLTDSAARQSFLDTTCSGSPGMRARIESLLAVEEPAEDFFRGAASIRTLSVAEGAPASNNGGVLNGAVAVRERATTEEPGERIGRYKLLQRLGEGGCGVVYMAEQEEPMRRRVALKIIRLGMDTESVIARFQAERQALALMDHPNIAHVLDAGATETGRPYFVMELVHGVKITTYCNENHLDTRQRLNLFIQICHAIQHAHQKGVIHRDIKPSNILVALHDAVPVPKVIDFGIAKATEGRLTDNTVFTAYEQFIGTPAYMSPEQAGMSGLDVDTRSDIYSLGVLLYELLTGRTPFDTKKLLQSGVDEIRRTLREREPPPPSTMLTTLNNTELKAIAAQRDAEPPRLILSLRGDLDWIVMKALEKDRRRRYETANGLAMEIQRHLNNEPVTARPPSRLYRFQKLVRRNKIVFAAGTAVAVALIAGMGTSMWLFFKEREARREQAVLREQAEVREKITQAALLVSQERFDEAHKLIAETHLNRSTLEGAAVFRSLGEWYALRNRWKQAADYFTALLKVNELDGWDVVTLDHLECGPALIEVGDTDAYERFRQSAIAKFAGTTYPVGDRIVKISLLLPADQQIVSSLDRLAEGTAKSLAANEGNNGGDTFQAAWQSLSLALLEYRRGDCAKATEWSRRCLAYPEHNAPRTATARIILAMACHQLRQADEARSELAQGRELIETRFKSRLERGNGAQGFWFDWVFARILLREATALIEGKPLPTASSAEPR